MAVSHIWMVVLDMLTLGKLGFATSDRICQFLDVRKTPGVDESRLFLIMRTLAETLMLLAGLTNVQDGCTVFCQGFELPEAS